MSTSLIKCKQEISVPSSVVSQRKEDFPEETVSSLLDRLFPKTRTSGILWQLKTDFQTGVRIIPWLQPTKCSLGEKIPQPENRSINAYEIVSVHTDTAPGEQQQTIAQVLSVPVLGAERAKGACSLLLPQAQMR